MGEKVFVEKGRVRLIGDHRDIGVSVEHRKAVWAWCEDNGITVHYQGTLATTDLWRVPNEQQRGWFMLRWT